MLIEINMSVSSQFDQLHDSTVAWSRHQVLSMFLGSPCFLAILPLLYYSFECNLIVTVICCTFRTK